MSENLVKQLPKLELICQLKTLKSRKLVLKEFGEDPKFCKAVREIVRNTLRKKILLPQKEKRKLRRYKKVIIGLSKKYKSQKKQKSLISQTGTGVFLPIVVPLVASVIASLMK